MPDHAPWDEIIVPSVDFNVRQIAGEMPVSCFWGRDHSGACLFIMELQGDHSVQYRKNIVAVNGINVDLRSGDLKLQRLVLALEKQADRDLFESLCLTLVSALRHASDSASALAVALSHIRRWKKFLSGRGGLHLSPEEVRGLFAELTFLLELITRTSATGEAVSAWLGSEKSHQDFIIGNRSIEIKSLSGTERSTVRISSEDQLESLNDELFLRIYRLSNLDDAKDAKSLNETVSSVIDQLNDAEAVEEFNQKLAAYGYVPLPDYDEPRFLVSEIRSYRVKDGFPRLVRSQLPAGIVKVAYDVKLEAIAEYQIDNGAIVGED